MLILFYSLFYFLFFTLLKTYCRMKIMRRNCRQSGAKINEIGRAGVGNSLLRQHNFNNNAKSKSKVFLAPKIMHCWAGCAPETDGRVGLTLAACLVCLAALKRHLLSAKRYKLPEHKMLHAPRTTCCNLTSLNRATHKSLLHAKVKTGRKIV